MTELASAWTAGLFGRCAATVCASLALAAAAMAQHDALLGRVRAAGRAVQADVRAFCQPSRWLAWQSEAWQNTTAPQPIAGSTDADGRFRLTCGGRAAVWFTAADVGAFAQAAPGVPLLIELRPLAHAVLPDGARGAHVRIDGVSVGFVAGTRLDLPAGDVELLIEGATLCCTFAQRLQPGDEVHIEPPRQAAPRLLGARPGTFAVLPQWPARRFVADPHGALTLPSTATPVRARIVTTWGAERCCDEVWIEPAAALTVARDEPRWRELLVQDTSGRPLAGATIVTLRTGPGQPAPTAWSESDARGAARCRTDIERSSVVVDAPGFALLAISPLDLERRAAVRLQPARTLRLRVLDADGRELADAQVTTSADPRTQQRAWTDARGGALLDQLPPAEITVAITHQDHAPATATVDTTQQSSLEVSLEPGLQIAGNVVCADGKRRDDVMLEVWRRCDPDAVRRRVLVAADGTFQLRGLQAGTFDLFAWRVERGVTWSGRAAEVAAGDTTVKLTIACDDPPSGSR